MTQIAVLRITRSNDVTNYVTQYLILRVTLLFLINTFLFDEKSNFNGRLQCDL